MMRALNYYAGMMGREYVLGMPSLLCGAAVCLCPAVVKMGFRVIPSTDVAVGNFAEAVGAALALLARADRLRFERVQTQIRVIANGPGGVAYWHKLRLCAFDPRIFVVIGDPGTTSKLIASALVYGATIGLVLRRGVVQNRRNWVRLEQLRCKEAKRFLKRVGVEESIWGEAGDADPICTPWHQRLPRFKKASEGWMASTSYCKVRSELSTPNPSTRGADKK